jgi:hypothetical protein
LEYGNKREAIPRGDVSNSACPGRRRDVGRVSLCPLAAIPGLSTTDVWWKARVHWAPLLLGSRFSVLTSERSGEEELSSEDEALLESEATERSSPAFLAKSR